jgi:NTP pyrophosphatase (non-canonical NTP hydrolase)
VDIETYMREARRFDNHRPETMLDALAHGLMAEVGEVMECIVRGAPRGDLLLELGDVKWNLIRLADEVGHDPNELLRYGWGPFTSDIEAAGNLVFYCSKMSGLMEKWYRETPVSWEMGAEIAHKLHAAWQSLNRLGDRYGFTPAQVSQANIDKLTRRYAERGLPVKEAS